MKNPMKYLIIAAGIVLLMTNCKKEEDIIIGQPFEIDFEFQQQVTDHLSITFESVTTDSRCPCEAACITAGEIGVTLKMSANGTTLTKLFTLDGYDGPTDGVFETDFENYRIQLIDVLPYPCNGQPETDSDYSVEITVTEI